MIKRHQLHQGDHLRRLQFCWWLRDTFFSNFRINVPYFVKFFGNIFVNLDF